MKKTVLLMIIAILLVLFLPQAIAYRESGKIGLLTVAESDNQTMERGGVADLSLVIKPGTGRIFIDSFPLSRLDTQITMRFASEMACDFLEMDCSGFDFFYTIRANTGIVGGPSAGAAATVLTISMLDDKEPDAKTIMTGTINSGNLIGPVSGISAKVLAAQAYGYTKVLIPKWDNSTYDSSITIEVIPVSSLEEALLEFTGKNYSKEYPLIIGSELYKSLMKDITTELCTKYGSIDDGKIFMPEMPPLVEKNSSNATQKEYFELAGDAIERRNYYSAASFCFGGNVVITQNLMELYDDKSRKKKYAELLGSLSEFESEFREKSKVINSISGLETYMIVIERISESREVLRSLNPENISTRQFAYALERLDTAKAWSKFLELESQNFSMDVESLKTVCSKKISEAEERINYLQLYIARKSDRDGLSLAYDYFYEKDYPMCIFLASRAKADADTVLSALFVGEENFQNLLDAKIDAAREAIAKQELEGIFPILGYSYYEYAKTLRGSDNYSSLIYAEYALELSNLDMYFPQKSKGFSFHRYSPSHSMLWAAVLGFILGVTFVIAVIYIYGFFISKKSKRKRMKETRKTPLAKSSPGKKR